MLILSRSSVWARFALAIAFAPAGIYAQPPVGVPATQQPKPAEKPADPGAEKAEPQSTDPTRPEDPLKQRERELEKYDPRARAPQAVDPLATDGLYLRSGNADPDGPIVDTSKGANPDLRREYTGPAVLSRSYSVERPSLPESVKFKPYVGVSAAYDSGLSQAYVGQNGVSGSQGLVGALVNFGVSGRHYWRHDIVQLDYAGNVSRYSPSSSYDGSNHQFSLGWTHLLKKKLKLSILNNTSHYSTSYTLTNPVLGPDINVANVNLATTPNVQIFDNSTTQLTDSVNLTYQKTSRLSFNLNASQFVTYRNGNGLVNVTGWQAGNDVIYRFTKKTSAGAYYTHSEYKYGRGIGDLSMETVGAIYSYAFDPRTEFHARVGISYLQNLGITAVSLDPAIAALLGQTSATIQNYSTQRTSDISVSLTRALRGERSIHAAYNRGITPGNGVFISSTQQVYEAGFNALLQRKYRISFSGGRNEMSSISQQMGQYTSNNIHFGLSRSVARNLQSDFGIDYRHFDISQTPLLKQQVRVTLGISWSNSEFPAKVF